MKVVWRINEGWGGQIVFYPMTIPKGAHVDHKHDPRPMMGAYENIIIRDNWATVTITRGKARWAAWILFWLQARPPKEQADG